MGSIIGKYSSFLLIGAVSVFHPDLLHVPCHRMNFLDLFLASIHCFLQFHLLYDEGLHDMGMLKLFLHCFTKILAQIEFFSKILVCLPINLRR